MIERRHHEHRAEQQRLADLGDELAGAGNPYPRLRRSADLEPARDEDETDHEQQHADAARDAMELGVVEPRRNQQPRRIAENRDAGEAERDQCHEDRESAHRRVSASSGSGRYRDGLVAILLEQREQAVAAHEMQRADHHQIVAVVLEQRFDLRQPLAIALA